MTSGPHTNGKPASHSELRLRLKPRAPTTGYVDGAWWPRSHDLTTEVAALATVLTVRLGRIERVAYALSTWDTTPRRVDLAGHSTRLEGFSCQDRNIVHVTGANGGRVSLLVVPPELAGAAGHDAMMKAARRGNADRPEEILAAAVVPAPRRDSAATKQGRDTR
jgi:hypothetical protein